MSSAQRSFSFAHVFSRFLHSILGSAALMLAAQSASAQGVASVPEGSRVQIKAVGVKQVVGVVRNVTPDSTVVFVEGNGGILKLANSDIKGVRISRGRTASEGAKKGALWGAVVGAGMAAVTVAAVNSEAHYTEDGSTANYVSSLVLGSVFWGAIIGTFTKAEKWDTLTR